MDPKWHRLLREHQMKSSVFLALALTGCLLGCKQEETLPSGITTKSPDGRLSVIVANVKHGATVSDVTEVYLSNGQDHALVLRADHASGVTAAWKTNGMVVLTMQCARIFSFRNFFDVLDKDGRLINQVNLVFEKSPVLCQN